MRKTRAKVSEAEVAPDDALELVETPPEKKLPSRTLGKTPALSEAAKRDKSARICAAFAAGDSLALACDAEEIGQAIFMDWVLRNTGGIGDDFARAMAMRADIKFMQIDDLAAEAEGLDASGVSAKRLRVETLKWSLARMLPKKYGDRIQQDAGGGAQPLGFIVGVAKAPQAEGEDG